jgi:hypothetical protein
MASSIVTLRSTSVLQSLIKISKLSRLTGWK